jgi:hypothetical protein
MQRGLRTIDVNSNDNINNMLNVVINSVYCTVYYNSTGSKVY